MYPIIGSLLESTILNEITDTQEANMGYQLANDDNMGFPVQPSANMGSRCMGMLRGSHGSSNAPHGHAGAFWNSKDVKLTNLCYQVLTSLGLSHFEVSYCSKNALIYHEEEDVPLGAHNGVQDP